MREIKPSEEEKEAVIYERQKDWERRRRTSRRTKGKIIGTDVARTSDFHKALSKRAGKKRKKKGWTGGF